MLTSVVQVRVNTGVAPALANMSMSIVARRAVAALPSVKLEATLKVMAKNRDMAAKNLPGMNARSMAVTLEATAVSNHNTVLTLIALADMVVRRNPATAVQKAWNMEVSDQISLMALPAFLEDSVRSLRAMAAAATTTMNMARGGKSMARVDMERRVTGDGTRHAVLCCSFARDPTTMTLLSQPHLHSLIDT